MCVCVVTPPMIYLEAFFVEITSCFFFGGAYKAQPEKTISHRRGAHGVHFCTSMFQYIWAVIIISNAFLFNGNDWFKTFVSPLHPLVCFTLSFASPFRAANNAYNHTCFGPHREKQTKPGKLKTKTLAKPKKTFERMFGFDSKDCFFFLYFLVLKWFNQNKLVFLNGYDQSRCIKKNKQNSSCFLFFFNILGLVFCIEKSQEPKINLAFLLISWLIISIQQKHFFRISISKPKQNRKNLGKTKTWVDTKHYLKCFVFLDLWFCSFLFLFVYWFTWLPFVPLCFLTLSVLGSQTLTKVS